MKKKWLFMFVTILTIAVLAACGNKDNENNDDNANNQENNENNSEANENGNNNNDSGDTDSQDAAAELPEADLEGIPDIVAVINGEEITKDDFTNMYEQQFQQILMQSQMMGQDMSDLDQDELKEHTADIMVNQSLLIQEANNRIGDVSEDDINETLDQLLAQNGMESKEDLLDALKEQDVDEEEFMSQVETQVKIDQLIADITKDITLTEEETKEAYETIKAQQEEAGSEEELPDYEDVKADLEEQLKEQKRAEETQTFIDQLRDDADVTIHL